MNVEGCLPSLLRPMREHSWAHPLPLPRQNPQHSQAMGATLSGYDGFSPAGLQPGLALELYPGGPWDIDCLGRGFEGPRKRMGRQPIKGEIWPERGLFSLALMFKGAGAKSNVTSAVCQGNGWTGEAKEPNSPLPSGSKKTHCDSPLFQRRGRRVRGGVGSRLAVISVD